MPKTNTYMKQIRATKQIQVVYNETTEFIKSDDEHIPWDGSIPQHGEGVKVVGVTIKA